MNRLAISAVYFRCGAHRWRIRYRRSEAGINDLGRYVDQLARRGLVDLETADDVYCRAWERFYAARKT